MNRIIFHNLHTDASGHEDFSTGSDVREQLLVAFEVLERLLVVDFIEQRLRREDDWPSVVSYGVVWFCIVLSGSVI